MANLTAHFKTTKHAIDGGMVESELRPYLGMSGLGHACPRYLWYSFHWYYTDLHSKRLKRLFARGHREEPELDKTLRAAGLIVNRPELIAEIADKTGFQIDSTNQIEMVNGFGHMKGHSDGVVENVPEAPKTPHLLEYKTASDSKFKGYKKKNNLRLSHPVYYAQTQLYMHHLKLTRCLWIVVNKNDDDIHIERIKYNADHANELLRRGEHILLASTPPAQPFPRTFFECKWCSAKPVCWDNAEPPKNCRTCSNSGIAHEGKWDCTISEGETVEIPVDIQRTGCKYHSPIPY